MAIIKILGYIILAIIVMIFCWIIYQFLRDIITAPNKFRALVHHFPILSPRLSRRNKEFWKKIKEDDGYLKRLLLMWTIHNKQNDGESFEDYKQRGSDELLAQKDLSSYAELLEKTQPNSNPYEDSKLKEEKAEDADPIENYIPENKFIDDNDFLLKILNIQKNNPDNFQEKTLSLWEDYLKNKVIPIFKADESEDLEKFLNAENKMIFNVLYEWGSFNLHKAGPVGMTIKDWNHPEVTKTIYSGHYVKCEIGTICEGDDEEFEYWDLFVFFPVFKFFIITLTNSANFTFYIMSTVYGFRNFGMVPIFYRHPNWTCFVQIEATPFIENIKYHFIFCI
jgi:hypothetical protein